VQELIGIFKPIAAAWIWSESILLALKQDPQVAHYAATYLKWSLLGLPAYGFNNIARRYFQSQGLFNVPTHITLVVAPINVLLNYLLGKRLFTSISSRKHD
jgi:MATE family multidrug resistance protein